MAWYFVILTLIGSTPNLQKVGPFKTELDCQQAKLVMMSIPSADRSATDCKRERGHH